MKILLVFAVYLVSGQICRVDCDEVTGYTGGSVLINCYFLKYVNQTKHFCKLDGTPDCTQKFLSNQTTAASPDQKIFTYDNQPELFSVLIKNITKQDNATYRCGVENVNKYTDVTLKVEEDGCCGKSFYYKAHPGETVTFTCKYPTGFQNYLKYLYKMTNNSLNVVFHPLGSTTQDGRCSISDHGQENLFNVSISNVTAEDSGVYLCAAQETNTAGNRNLHYSLFNEMQLEVTHLPGSSATAIAVSVCVVLLLIGGVALIFYKLRQIKPQDSSSASSTRRNSVNSEEAHQGPYYEEIPDAQPSISTVYATAEKPN